MSKKCLCIYTFMRKKKSLYSYLRIFEKFLSHKTYLIIFENFLSCKTYLIMYEVISEII